MMKVTPGHMTPEQVNEQRRRRYAEQNGKPPNYREIRNFGIIVDRVAGMSLREIARKRGVSVGCVRDVLSKT